jgi:isopenicillin N synthase-like dioxygenase
MMYLLRQAQFLKFLLKMIETIDMASGIPIIDMNAVDTCGNEILEAFSTIGFATLTNHGISQSLIERTFQASKSFFELPLASKQKFLYENHQSNRGYIPLGHESFTKDSPEQKETLDLGPKDDDWNDNKNWPSQELSGSFQEVMEEYFENFNNLNLRIMKLMAIAWNMEPENFLMDQCNEKHANLRLLHYPQMERGKDGIVQRGSVHTDFGTITLLTQDSVGGLLAQKLDGKWVSIPPVPGSIIVNVGEMLQRWTNNFLRATPHQVVELPNNGSERSPDFIQERFSIAFFCNANKNVVLRCLDHCVTPENPARYDEINSHDYLTMRLAQTISANRM